MRIASLLTLLLLPSLTPALGLPVLADFDDGMSSLGGAVSGYQAQLSLTEPSDFSGRGSSLRIVALGAQAQALLPLAVDGLALARYSSSQSVTVVWRAEATGSDCRVCLEGGTVLGELCATLHATDTDWHESSLQLPPSEDASAFHAALPQAAALKAASLTLRPQVGSAWRFDELRLDPPAALVSATAVAAAFACSPAQVLAARRLGLPELATWALLLLSQRSGVSPAALAAERSTRSWGEISQAHGMAWGDLMGQVGKRAHAAGLTPPDGSPAQELKAQDNHAFEGVRP
jgi:hypothetical protein